MILVSTNLILFRFSSYYYYNYSLESLTTMLVSALILALITLTISAPPKTYSVSSGRMNFNQTQKSRSAIIPIFPNPIVLYSLSSMRVTGYFSYHSNHTLTNTSSNQSKLTITAQISKVSFYEIVIGYLVIQSMPNIEDGIVKLTMDDYIVTFKSKKKIKRDNYLNVAAHLIGFSSSKIAGQNFYYTAVFDHNYQIWTSSEFSPVDYIIIHFFIMNTNYQQNNTICKGSFIESVSKSHNLMSPYQVNIDSSLHILLGVEAINLPNADFNFSSSSKQIIMSSTGAYSFSIIAFNTTCERLWTSNIYYSSQNQNVYGVVFIVFLTLCCLFFTFTIIICVIKVIQRKKTQNINKQSEISVQDKLQQNNSGIKTNGLSSVVGSLKNLIPKKKMNVNPNSSQLQTGIRIKSSQKTKPKEDSKKKKKKKTTIQQQKQQIIG